MTTLAHLGFIAGAAAVAIGLARTPTVADGGAVAADRLEEVRRDGVTAMACDDAIPIGRWGARFRCVATLVTGDSQVVDYMLTPGGEFQPRPQPPTRTKPARKPAPGDPWGDRP